MFPSDAQRGRIARDDTPGSLWETRVSMWPIVASLR